MSDVEEMSSFEKFKKFEKENGVDNFVNIADAISNHWYFNAKTKSGKEVKVVNYKVAQTVKTTPLEKKISLEEEKRINEFGFSMTEYLMTEFINMYEILKRLELPENPLKVRLTIYLDDGPPIHVLPATDIRGNFNNKYRFGSNRNYIDAYVTPEIPRVLSSKPKFPVAFVVYKDGQLIKESTPNLNELPQVGFTNRLNIYRNKDSKVAPSGELSAVAPSDENLKKTENSEVKIENIKPINVVAFQIKGNLYIKSTPNENLFTKPKNQRKHVATIENDNSAFSFNMYLEYMLRKCV